MKDAGINMKQLLCCERVCLLQYALGAVILIFSIIIFKIDSMPGWPYIHFDAFIAQPGYKIHFLFSERRDQYISQSQIAYSIGEIKRSASCHAHDCFGSDHFI